MLYNMCHVLLYDMCHVILYNMCHEEEPLLIYTARGSPFRRKKLSVINGSPEQQRTLNM